MYNRSKILALAVLLCLLFIPISEFIASIHSTNNPTETNPKFVIAGWDYPDEYGQGIDRIRVEENSTGSWVYAGIDVDSTESSAFEWNASVAIKLRCWSWINNTLVGDVSDSALKNYQRHNVIVTQINGTIVFSQDNFTYSMYYYDEDPMFYFEYFVILNFLPETGEIYTVNVDYEVFYLGGSGEYETSDQSIDSFSETLPNDVLYYTDAFTDLIERPATSGDDDYEDSWILDSVLWETTGVEGADFLVSDATIEGFSYHCYGKETIAIGTSVLEYYNGTSWLTLDTFTTSNTWYNDTVEGLYATDTVQLRINTYAGDTTIQVDFLSISAVYMTLAENGYAESFSDVSDFVYQSDGNLDPGQYGFGSDGDVGELWADFQDADNEWVVYEYELDTAISIESYLEHRFKSESSSVMMYIQIIDSSAATYYVVSGGLSTTWYTGKTYLGSSGLDDIKKVRLRTDDVASAVTGNLSIYWDYLRISPANESGWQHDGSTSEGISSSDGGTIATDGDNLTLTSDVDGSSFEFVIDTTATPAYLATAYYPFLIVNCTYVTEGDGWKLQQYDGAAWATLQGTYITSDGTYRYNIASLDTYVQKFRFNFTQTAIINFDFIKACGIANWTYTGTGTSVDDVLYVSDGTLYCSATEITSMVLDHDPPLSIELPIGSTWEITTSSGVPQTDYYLEGAWVGYSSETEGIFANGTLTDVRIKFTDSANIAAIEFLYPLEDWALVSNPTLIFSVPYDYWALNMGLIFGGLILMLLSTCIVAKKVRDKNISKDAGMILLLLFCVGWGLFIGGAVIG